MIFNSLESIKKGILVIITLNSSTITILFSDIRFTLNQLLVITKQIERSFAKVYEINKLTQIMHRDLLPRIPGVRASSSCAKIIRRSIAGVLVCFRKNSVRCSSSSSILKNCLFAMAD